MAFLALIQLRQLRKAWIGDWNYDTSSNRFLYAICHLRDGSLDVISTSSLCSLPLIFPTKEMAVDFLDCFIDLCESEVIAHCDECGDNIYKNTLIID